MKSRGLQAWGRDPRVFNRREPSGQDGPRALRWKKEAASTSSLVGLKCVCVCVCVCGGALECVLHKPEVVTMVWEVMAQRFSGLVFDHVT